MNENWLKAAQAIAKIGRARGLNTDQIKVTLAIAALESGRGSDKSINSSDKYNNWFNITASENYKGNKRTGDDTNAKGEPIDQVFRVYKSVDESVNDFYDLMNTTRYSHVFYNNFLEADDIVDGLKTAGYAEDPHWPIKLKNTKELHLDTNDIYGIAEKTEGVADLQQHFDNVYIPAEHVNRYNSVFNPERKEVVDNPKTPQELGTEAAIKTANRFRGNSGSNQTSDAILSSSANEDDIQEKWDKEAKQRVEYQEMGKNGLLPNFYQRQFNKIHNLDPNYGMDRESRAKTEEFAKWEKDEASRLIYQEKRASRNQGDAPDSPVITNPLLRRENEYNADNSKLTKEEEKKVLDEFNKETGKNFLTAEELSKYIKKPSTDVGDMMAAVGAFEVSGVDADKDPIASSMWDTIENFYENNPQLVENYIKRTRVDAIGKATGAALGLLFGGRDVSESVRQIRAGNAGLKDLVRPVQPEFHRTPSIDESLTDSRRELDLQMRKRDQASLAPAVETYRGEIADAYARDKAAAKTAATSASEYGAYARGAANRNYKGGRQLADFIREDMGRQDELVGTAMDRYGQSASRKMFENRSLDRFNTEMYDYKRQDYNQDRDYFGGLASQGRGNLRNSLYNVSNSVPEYISAFANPNLNLGKDVNIYAQYVNRALANQASDPVNFYKDK